MKKHKKNYAEEILEKFGFNPLVKTCGPFNKIPIERSIALNREDLEYLLDVHQSAEEGCEVYTRGQANKEGKL